MERGPLALFGAILAVGLGPALWLGAQLGAVNLAPGQRPAPVDEQFPGADMDFGGAGAGEMPDDEPLSTYTYTPLTSTTSPSVAERSPEAGRVSVRPVPPSPPPRSPSPSVSPSSSAKPSGSPSTSDSSSPSVQPSGSVSAPVDPDPEHE
ncbi:hypothetical protein [Actinoplanes sichuanensis]|uniref:Serine/threonine protein kinase n=1 Tax=Actinoplanes sichuanensis TaxID=512349 RepID=A0ABW4AF80_9ACTN|nr:hypothetical protein [Actinoplanes sichuanensis]